MLKRFSKIAFTMLLITSFTSCLPVETPGCEKPFQKTVQPAEIKGWSHIFVKSEALDFMDDPKLVLKNVQLTATLRGSLKNISLALNGLKITRRDGAPFLDQIRFDRPTNSTHVKISLHKMFLNGAIPFHMFVAQIRKNRGELKLSLLGQNLHILEASLNFQGKKLEDCEPGSEDPKPGEKDPGVTTINRVTPAEALTKSTTVQFKFSNTLSGNLFYCALDGAPAVLCASPQVYSGLNNGAHHFTVFAKTPSGVAETTPAGHQWTVDTIAPKATITNAAGLPTLTNQSSMSFEISATESGALLCSLDGGEFKACQSPYTVSDLAEGVHSFAVNVRDNAGNLGEAPDLFQWSVDMTAPVAGLVSVQPPAAIGNADHKTFAFAADESAYFECSVDNEAFAPCESPFTLQDLAEGRHWFEVRARDLAGNLGLGSSYSWNVDLTAPVLAIDSYSPALGVSNAKSVAVEFSVSELAAVTCRLDNTPAAICTSPFEAHGLTEGDHVLSLWAVDEAGNSSHEAQLNWSLDFTAPMISFGAIQPAGSFNHSRELSAVVNASENSQLIIHLNGQVLDHNTTPVLLSNLDEGAYVLTVQARDSAGNLSNIIQHEFAVDMTAPVLELASVDQRSPVSLDHRSFTFTASEEVRFECQLDAAGFMPCTSPAALSGLADGTHLFEVRAVDLSGNVSLVGESAWVVDTRAPQVTISATVTQNSVAFVLSADESVTGFECSLDQEPFRACPADLGYGDLAAGPHVFTARAADAAGNRNEAGSTYHFQVSMPVETFITTPAVAVTNQRSISISFAANQAQATFLCALDGQAFTACTSPVTYSGLEDGAHRMQVYAVDQFGHADNSPAAYVWSIDASAPVVAGPSLQTTRSMITLNWTTSEPAMAQVHYGTDSQVDQQTAETSVYVTSHMVQLTGLVANTTYTLQVSGRDRAGNVYLSTSQTARTAR